MEKIYTLNMLYFLWTVKNYTAVFLRSIESAVHFNTIVNSEYTYKIEIPNPCLEHFQSVYIIIFENIYENTMVYILTYAVSILRGIQKVDLIFQPKICGICYIQYFNF